MASNRGQKRRGAGRAQPPATRSAGAPQRQQVQMLQQIEQRIEQRMSSGPIPDAEELAKYEGVLNGLANRIVTMAETQMTHRMAIERHIVKSVQRRSWAGLAAGFLVCMAGFFLAYRVAVDASPAAGAVIGTIDLVALVGLFIYAERRQRTG